MSARPDTTFAFVLGTGRCGSSLLHELLARHRDVGFVSNVDDRLAALDLAGRANAAIYRFVPPSLTRKGRPRFAPSEGYRILGHRVSPAIVDPVRDLVAADATPWLAGRFGTFFRERAEAQRRQVFLHKFTGWPRAGFVDAVLPGSRFVNVVRDGRAVASSLLQMPWWRGYRGPDAWGWGPLPHPYALEWDSSGRSFAVLAGLEWKLLMDAFDAARSRIGLDRWLDVRYEDLVTSPRDVVTEVLAFLGLAWTPAFERAVGRQPFESSRTDAYRRDLRPRDVEALESSLADHLRRYGYVVDAEARRVERGVVETPEAARA
jgi:hypothetical protein